MTSTAGSASLGKAAALLIQKANYSLRLFRKSHAIFPPSTNAAKPSRAPRAEHNRDAPRFAALFWLSASLEQLSLGSIRTEQFSVKTWAKLPNRELADHRNARDLGEFSEKLYSSP